MQPDLIQRSRGGDRDAFAGLVSLWADRCLQIALACTTDYATAVDAVAVALPEVYRALPTLHPEAAFRPWLMRHVLAAAGDTPRDERLRVVLAMRSRRDIGRADTAIAAHLVGEPRLRLPERFFVDRVEPALVEPSVRAAAGPPSAARVDDLALAIAAASGERITSSRAVAGMQRRTRGSVTTRRSSHDTVLILAAAPGAAMAWSVRSRLRGLPGSLDAIYDAADDGDQLVLRLRGIALPEGRSRRVWEKIAAKTLEGRAQRLHGALAGGGR